LEALGTYFYSKHHVRIT